jgi:hypothetical protein
MRRYQMLLESFWYETHEYEKGIGCGRDEVRVKQDLSILRKLPVRRLWNVMY